jgi:hypothetical protein
LVQEQLARTFYGTRFELASDTEQRYLAAMASLGHPPYATSDVARAWGAESQRQTSPHRDSLIQKGLIWSPRRGQVDFTVPLFAEFLLAHHPSMPLGTTDAADRFARSVTPRVPAHSLGLGPGASSSGQGGTRSRSTQPAASADT